MHGKAPLTQQISICLFLILITVGCTQATPTNRLPTITLMPSIAPTSGESSSRGDFGASWAIAGEHLSLDIRGHSILIHGLYLGPKTILVYSESVSQNGSGLEFSMSDDKGREIPFVSSFPLKPIGNLQFIVMLFGHREPGANSLFLNVDSNKLLIAKHIGPSEEGNLNQQEYGLFVTSTVTQGDYRISAINWIYSPVDNQIKATLIPPGLTEDNVFTIQMEDISNQDKFFYLIQFLSNGEVIGSVIK